MTVLTKPSNIIKKPDVTKSPLVHENKYDEEKIEVHTPRSEWSKRASGALVCLTLTAILMVIAGISSGVLVYRQYLRSENYRYQAFCSIPIPIDPNEFRDTQMTESNFRLVPVRWSAEPELSTDDVQVWSVAGDSFSDTAVDTLRERFDIAGTVEKVSIFDNGRTVKFIHDFDTNVTGIVDEDRCFSMDLDLNVVLTPDLFMYNLEKGAQFDVSRVRTTLRAILPALKDITKNSRALAMACVQRPVYRLLKEDGVTIRKRSTELTTPDFRQFSGKHVQEIEINNLGDLLEHEKNKTA